MLKSFILLFTAVSLGHSLEKLQQVFQWRALDFEYPSEEIRQYAKFTKDFVPENNLPVGIEVWRNKLFVTVPRWEDGVPSTLNYIPLDAATSSSPNLIPYPSWEANQVPPQPQDQCDTLTTTYRIKADSCDRLWVLDSGTVGIGNTTKQICPYAIHVFDLKTDRRIRKYQFRPEDILPGTFIANIAVDVGKNCEDTFLYASDELAYGLLSYSWEENTSWRASHGFFFPDPLLVRKMAQYQSCSCTCNQFSMYQFDSQLIPDKFLMNRMYIFSIPISFGHLTSHVMDHNGILYFNLIDRNAVGCWNSQYPYKPENIGHIDIDNEALIFPSDVKVVGDDLWVISDRMPIHLESELNFNDVNFRIFTVPLQEAVRGTVCESPLVPAGYQKPALYGPLTYVDNNLYPIQPYVPNYIPQNKPKNFFTKKIFARPELPSYVTEPDIPIPQNNQLAFPQNNQLAVPQNNQQGAKFVPSYNPQPQVNTWSYNKFYNL
ncbi:protein yellow-like [Diaphorina citri]|uniref:Protein yellow n=1 Tax=Diaphorina citri TaxID=121845 RepID=A0A1S3CY34_DIACI|nr:protein yellow-like [Diaphorina citri]